MRKVIGIGETVFDIIFKDEQPVTAVPGGSTFNALISLGRSGVPCSFISETGDDRIGRIIVRFLEENGVEASGVNVFSGTRSPLSLAFLNERNDAEYVFYKDHPNDRLDFVYPEVNVDDVVLFGSYYALNPVIRNQVRGFLEYAKERGAILYYDVNFRPSHQHEVVKLTPNLLENFALADIVRGSNEDFAVLFGKDTCDKVYQADISFYCKRFIYTQGANPVELRAANGFQRSYPVAPTETVSTIGAGDSFNAGIIFGLLKHGITREMLENGLSESQWDALVDCAQLFSGEVCKTLFNYVSADFGNKMKQSAC